MKKRPDMEIRVKSTEGEMSQLVDLVLKPIIFFLRFNGFSVPPACARLRPQRPWSGVDGNCNSELNWMSQRGETHPSQGTERSRDETCSTETVNLCPKCKAVCMVTKIHSVFIAILFFVNAVRYTSVFYPMSTLNGQFVSALVFQIFFVLVAFMYVLSTRSVSKRMPVIIRQLQAYEEKYGTAVDCGKFFRKTAWRCNFYFWLQALFSIGFVVAEQTVFPSLQAHLAPFSTVEGVGYYLVLTAFAIVLYFAGSVMFSLVGFLAIMTIILHKEFSCVAKELLLVLPRSDHRLKTRTKSFYEVTGHLRKRKGKNRFRCPTKCCSSVSCLKSTTSFGDSPVVPHGPNFEAPFPNEAAEVTYVTALDSNTDTRKVFDISGGLKTLSLESVHSESEIQEGHHKVPNAILREQSTDVDDTETACTTLSPCRPQDAHESREMEFDVVHSKHQTLCELVDSTNKCVKHLICMSFVCGIFLSCLIIYGLGSGALDLANILYQVWNIVFSVFFVTLTTALGIALNDAAHAPQDVIYAADWSQLSDRLLYKAQLFASRLGHTKIGYDVYGLFVIDKSTVLMVLGTLLTYTIVVIQFQQGPANTSSSAADNSTVAG
ncbi:hypothetical protein BaRGS_00028142 [Batillaria attramentaria]|uniref:Gustatory receptor n=1 Tax=Batillaria attramentaria TaxID=370345 RepID=A0ABD0K0P9_9CAEN